ncbi:Protein of unknown function [Gryllus bimaculatus]|nr:Protein of unknown function [Gryllus bimaculatus]
MNVHDLFRGLVVTLFVIVLYNLREIENNHLKKVETPNYEKEHLLWLLKPYPYIKHHYQTMQTKEERVNCLKSQNPTFSVAQNFTQFFQSYRQSYH